MKISVIHPSRSRKELALKTIQNWYQACDDKTNFEYILSTDADDFSYNDDCFDRLYDNFKRIKSVNRSVVGAVNNAAKVCCGSIIVVISDDFDTPPQHWDALLLHWLKDKSDFCVKTHDGLQPTLITLPIVDRIYYERYGYIYNPEFLHMFVDQDMTAVALMTGKYLQIPITFEHNHYSTGKTLKDALNARNDATWKQGEKLFNERLKTNFGIAEPVMQYSEIQWR
jgi:hypothetical protein